MKLPNMIHTWDELTKIEESYFKDLEELDEKLKESGFNDISKIGKE